MWDESRRRLVEPNAPYAPLGILHLAGEAQKEKSFTLATTDGDRMTTGLCYSDLRRVAPG
jgi:hypothetical protein